MASAEEAGPVLPSRTAIPVTSVPKVSSKNLQELLHKLSVEEKSKPHQFWDTQPVPRLSQSLTCTHAHSVTLSHTHTPTCTLTISLSLLPTHFHCLLLFLTSDERVEEAGPLEPDKTEVREDPYSLSDKFMWDEVDLTDEAQISELYSLLNENYVEDEDNMFRYTGSCGTVLLPR